MSYKIVSKKELEQMIQEKKGYKLYPFDTTGPRSPRTPVIGVCSKGVGYFTSKEDAFAYAKAHPKTTTRRVQSGTEILTTKVKNYDLPENREYEFCPIFGLKPKTGGGFTAVCKVQTFKREEVLTLAGKILR